jgi:RNA ligase (TIGR02306 family)
VRAQLIANGVLKENEENKDELIGYDVTALLGIQRYETASTVGSHDIGRPFPSFIPKTDQERIQNLGSDLNEWKEKRLSWEVTEKIEGTSCTIYYDGPGDYGTTDTEEMFGVCSRNLDLTPPKEKNESSRPVIYWQIEKQNNIIQKIKDSGRRLAVQGEIIASGVQHNLYGLKSHEIKFYVFDIYDLEKKSYLPPVERRDLCEQFGLVHAPIISDSIVIPIEKTMDTLIDEAEGNSKISNKGIMEREGVIFKSNEERISFKCISNKFLMANKL